MASLSGREPSFRLRVERGGYFAVGCAHAALLAYGAVVPAAMLQWDRASLRLPAVEALSAASSLSEALTLLASKGSPGDFAWQAGVLALSGGSWPAVQAVQLLLLAMSLVAVYRIAELLGLSHATRTTAVFVYALIPVDFVVPHVLGAEAWFNPLLVLATMLLVRGTLRSESLRDLLGGAGLYALAALTRAELLPWLSLPLVYVFLASRRRPQSDAVARTAWFALALLAVPLLWYGGVGLARDARVDGDSISVGFELRLRARQVLQGAGDDLDRIRSDAPVSSYLDAASRHPGVFLRDFALHVAKMMALPDNLSLFRYFQAFEFTGDRSNLVHEHGPLGALRASYAEMPGLTSWLLVTIVLWLGVLVLVGVGAVHALRVEDYRQRLTWLLLMSLPFVWVLIRLVTQGEPRKRSPVDFALALFAAVGLEVVLELRRRRAGAGAPPREDAV